MEAVIRLGFSVGEFRNVDLFEKGIYQIQCTAVSDRHKIEVLGALELDPATIPDEYSTHAFPGKLLPRKLPGFKTQPCDVKYSDDSFNVHTAIDCIVRIKVTSSEDLQTTLQNATIDLVFALNFNVKDRLSLRTVSTRTIRLHGFAAPGLHRASTITFDFFHTCSVDMAVFSLCTGFQKVSTPLRTQRRPSGKFLLAPLRRRLSQRSKLTRDDSTGQLLPDTEWGEPSPDKPMLRRSSSLVDGASQTSQLALLFDDKEAFLDTSLDEQCEVLFRLTSVVQNSLEHLATALEKRVANATIEPQARMDVSLAATEINNKTSAEADRFVASRGDFADYTACVRLLIDHAYEKASEQWAANRYTLLFDVDILEAQRKHQLSEEVYLLQHGVYVYEQPRQALSMVKGSRSQNLLIISQRIRASAFFKTMAPLALENITDSIAPNENPLLFEYRHFESLCPSVTELEVLREARPMHLDVTELQKSDVKTYVGPTAHFRCDIPPVHPHMLKSPRDTGNRHLVVCVHGLAGNQYDLRLVRLQLLKVFPDMVFLMSSANTSHTHSSFPNMTDRFVEELKCAIRRHTPRRISMIGHSLGNLIIRAALSLPEVQDLIAIPSHCSSDTAATASTTSHTIDSPSSRRRNAKPVLHTYISFSGPHLGAIYLGGLVSAGMWFLSKWKRSASLSALSLSDSPNPRASFVYLLSKTNSMLMFKSVVLVASPQDKYVNLSSALLHHCSSSTSDSRLGPVFEEMAKNLIAPLETCPHVEVTRLYICLPPGSKSVASMIGRAAHIAVLDEESVARKIVASIAHHFDGEAPN